MPTTFIAFLILVILGGVGLWFGFSRFFIRVSDFITNKIFAPFKIGEESNKEDHQ